MLFLPPVKNSITNTLYRLHCRSKSVSPMHLYIVPTVVQKQLLQFNKYVLSVSPIPLYTVYTTQQYILICLYTYFYTRYKGTYMFTLVFSKALIINFLFSTKFKYDKFFYFFKNLVGIFNIRKVFKKFTNLSLSPNV